MKITHITEAWSGGISTYVLGLVKFQSSLKEVSEVNLVYCSDRTKENLQATFKNNEKVKLISYSSSRNPLKIYGVCKKIAKILQYIKPDIIHLHSTFPGVYGRLIKKYPTVYCAHGWSFVQEENFFKRKIYQLIEYILAKKTDAIINISNHEFIMAKKAKIKARYNQMIFTSIMDEKNKNIANLNIDKGNINIGFIGRLDHKKGFDLIEPIFRNLDNENIKLFVIGENDRDKNNNYENSKNIEYLGWVDNKNLDSYLKFFNAIIVPSRHEAFGIVVLEAMKNKKCVIASNRGSLPELISDNYNGYIFDLNNTNIELPRILENLDKKILKKLGDNAYKSYKSNFSGNKYAVETINLYKKII